MVLLNVLKSYPINLQFSPATNPYLPSVTVAATAYIELVAVVKVEFRVPVMFTENWFTLVVAVDALVDIGE